MLIDKLSGTSVTGTSDKKSQLYIGQYFGIAKPAKFAELSEQSQKDFFAKKSTIEAMQEGRTIITEICNAIGYTCTKSDILEENGSAIFDAMLHFIAKVQQEKAKK